MTKRDEEYASALRLLDDMRDRGELPPSSYEVRRARLLQEAANPARSTTSYLVRLAVIVVIVMVLLFLLAAIRNATG